MIFRSVLTVGALGALILGSGCQEEEIVLARLPPAVDGAANEGSRCVENAECGPGALCSRRACSDVAGTCEARPVLCAEDAAPVCGCDGTTYWNDCVRLAAGVSPMRGGECGSRARRCTTTCPNGGTCARLLSFDRDDPGGGMHGSDPNDSCREDVPGECWVLPAVCPNEHAGPDRWDDCGSAATSCVTTCDAIRSGRPHKRATSCR